MEQTRKRLVTFSKRKLGLFRKTAELSLLCDSQIAVIVFFQFGKVFSSGYPDPDAVICRYLSGASSSSSSFSDPTPVHDPERESAPLRREFEEAMKMSEEENKFVNADSGRSGCGHGLWWNRSVEQMGLEEVVQFKECVEQLRQNVAVAAEEKKKSTWLIASQSPPVTKTEEKKSTWLIHSQSPLPRTTAKEKKCTWLIDTQLLPWSTVESMYLSMLDAMLEIDQTCQVFCLGPQLFHLCHLELRIVRFFLLLASGPVRLPHLSSYGKLRTTMVHLGGPCPLGDVLQHPLIRSCSTPRLHLPY